MKNYIMYKAVSNTRINMNNPKSDKIFYSACVSNIKYELYYSIGEVTSEIPNTLGIFVFDTLENAKNFIRGTNQAILKCMARGKRKVPEKISRTSTIDIFYKYHQCFVNPTPKGTLLFKSVLPVEIVAQF